MALSSVVNPANHTVTAQTGHFTKFAVFAPTAIAPPPIPTDIPTPPDNPSAVPEPGTLLLFGVGLFLLLAKVAIGKHRK